MAYWLKLGKLEQKFEKQSERGTKTVNTKKRDHIFSVVSHKTRGP